MAAKRGPLPTMARGPRSQANLKRTAGPGRPKMTEQQKADEKEAKKLSRKLLLDPKYLANLKERLESGRIQPGVEVALWYYAFGKPTETIETKQVIPVRIQHEYSE